LTRETIGYFYFFIAQKTINMIELPRQYFGYKERMGLVKILTWNVNGYKSAYEKGDFKKILNSDYDIICLQGE